MNTKRVISLFVLLLTLSASAQVTTAIDSTKKKIGAQFNLTLKTTVDTSASVVFPSGKNFGPLEVIRNYKIDTIEKGKTRQLIKRYGLTQFDSGAYTLPRLQVLINKKPFLTDSLRLEVIPVKVDTLKQKMYDIRDIIREGEISTPWWKYLLYIFGAAGVGALVYWLIKKNKVIAEKPVEIKTPIEKASTLLQELERKQLWQKGEVKAYYSELTDIARNYIEEAIHIPAMESTTSELIVGLRDAARKKHMNLTPETLENLERVLMQADLVKFAKSRPLEFEIAEDRKKIEKTIVVLDQAIPQQAEEEDDLIEKYQQQRLEEKRRKDRRRKMVIGIASGVGVIVSAFVLFGLIKGFDNVKDLVTGNASRELLEGEWVTSEYGNPPMSVQTPKVLTRIINNDTLQTNFSEQKFQFGGASEPMQIMLITTQFRDSIDVAKVMDAALAQIPVSFEKNLNAQNITVKSDPFKSRTGQDGTKTFGSMKVTEKVTGISGQLNYEVLTFVQSAGVDQLFVIYRPDDKHASEIAGKMFDSVEIKPALKWVK